jgi:methionine-rich copper-binding protein CopC
VALLADLVRLAEPAGELGVHVLVAGKPGGRELPCPVERLLRYVPYLEVLVTHPLRRAVQLTLLSTVAVLAALPLAAVPASAHNELRSSSPRDGDALTKAPANVELVFAEKPDARFLKVAVTAADGRNIALGQPTVDGFRVVQPLNPVDSGRYTLAYRVVSSDGHPIQGTLKYTVTLPAREASPSASAPVPVRPAAEAAPTKASANTQDDGALWWPYATGGALLLALVAFGAVLATRRRRTA